jgi:hypothetical protein
MTATRIPSEAELIELERWAVKLHERFEKSWADWYDDDFDMEQWRGRYPELPLYPLDRERLYENLRLVLDLARTVQNP